MGDQGLIHCNPTHSTQAAGLHSRSLRTKSKVYASCCSPSSWNKCWLKWLLASACLSSLGSFLFSYQHHTFSDLTTLHATARQSAEEHCSLLHFLLPVSPGFCSYHIASCPRSPLPPANPYSHFLDLVLFDLSAASVTGDPLFFSSN